MVPTDLAAADSKLLIPAWFLRDHGLIRFQVDWGRVCRGQDTLPVQRFAPARTVPTWYNWPKVPPCTEGQVWQTLRARHRRQRPTPNPHHCWSHVIGLARRKLPELTRELVKAPGKG